MSIKLRKLMPKDAEYMLEWMHDSDITAELHKDFSSMTIDNCRNFIESSQGQVNDVHMAIADTNDEYMGTVSIKNIHNGCGEFAIVVRRSAMGKGYAADGMKAIIDYGLHTVGLKEVYWCVRPENKRAVRFYEKNGYKRFNMTYDELISRLGGQYSLEEIQYMYWFIAN